SWLASISEFFSVYTKAIAETPWLERFPIALENIRVLFSEKGWQLIDKEGYILTLGESQSTNYWQLLALSGGHPIKIFGEWYLDQVWPLTIYVDNQFYSIKSMYK
ncbi:MAG: SWIM zinc finger-containing protein, partial [bacterium]